MSNIDILSRAQGCMLGQLAGDSLGSMVEFQTPEQIRLKYPNNVRELADGGIWNILAGQPTDDSEMALILARTLVKHGKYKPDMVREAYIFWLDSGPFDCGYTIGNGLCGTHNPDSQANGAMMRISPLGIFGTNYSFDHVDKWARQDAMLTHINPICLQANSLYTRAIAYAIKNGLHPEEVYHQISDWANAENLDESLRHVINAAKDAPPSDYVTSQGWVLIAFQNALWQLLHAENIEEGVIDTVMRGGDTDTNAAICGALLGAIYGRQSIPARWTEKILNCRPDAANPKVRHPRPECFWPVDALALAEDLLKC